MQELLEPHLFPLLVCQSFAAIDRPATQTSCLAALCCRYEFFAPIWRVMRDDNMPVAEVARQVEAVALAVKQGSSISDMRHHQLTGKIRGAQVRQGRWHGLMPLDSARGRWTVWCVHEYIGSSSTPNAVHAKTGFMLLILPSWCLLLRLILAAAAARWCTSGPTRLVPVTM
jgi:hypothetical protein